MYFQVKMSENSGSYIFRDKERTNKVPPMFLDLNMLTERLPLFF